MTFKLLENQRVRKFWLFEMVYNAFYLPEIIRKYFEVNGCCRMSQYITCLKNEIQLPTSHSHVDVLSIKYKSSNSQSTEFSRYHIQIKWNTALTELSPKIRHKNLFSFHVLHSSCILKSQKEPRAFSAHKRPL